MKKYYLAIILMIFGVQLEAQNYQQLKDQVIQESEKMVHMLDKREINKLYEYINNLSRDDLPRKYYDKDINEYDSVEKYFGSPTQYKRKVKQSYSKYYDPDIRDTIIDYRYSVIYYCSEDLLNKILFRYEVNSNEKFILKKFSVSYYSKEEIKEVESIFDSME